MEEEKRIKHYSSWQQILLVGEGDFSFALSLARAFGSASNIIHWCGCTTPEFLESWISWKN
ncbi:Heavy metal-associated isoprenylated plant protein 41 [Stylosanthes scabra]|uniref:Heavy metal-associated isoprenylated plant protein 41 n=1 Tax=Stylosanthes scabra TaxID=79078 RepID=A0ABU6Z9W3_9FABA|nr:Heavy metal-associated isoprenylated plant protein 41 [Stylosanthes scabra]